MFARVLERLTGGPAFAVAALIALIVGTACKGPEEPVCRSDSVCNFAVVASGAKVIPTPPPADTSARASVSFRDASLAYMYSVAVAPSGTIDSIALYQVGPQGPLPASATAILCAGVTACAATSGMGTVVPPATVATIITSMRGYGTQLVFFTTTAQQAAGGAMRGTVYPTGQ